jgi:hypothetical protein
MQEIFCFLQNVQTGTGVHRSSYVFVTGGETFLGSKEGVRLTSHLHPVWRLTMHGVIPPPTQKPSWHAQDMNRDNFIFTSTYEYYV